MRIAAGGEFCGRKKEVVSVSRKLTEGKHVWVQSEHLNGLSSYLIKIQERLSRSHQIKSFLLDLNLVTNSADAIKALSGAYTALATLSQDPKSLKTRSADRVGKFFSLFSSVEAAGLRINLIDDDDVADSSAQLLSQQLDFLIRGLGEHSSDEKVVLVIDGLENLSIIDTPNGVMRKSLKSLLERKHGVSVLMGGSTPELLQQAGKSLGIDALYSRADKMTLPRIPTAEWLPFIKERFLNTHDLILPTGSGKFLLSLCENSTNYVVYLTDVLLNEPLENLKDSQGLICLEKTNDLLRGAWLESIKQNFLSLEFNLFELKSSESRSIIQALSKSGPQGGLELLDSVDNASKDDLIDLIVNGYITKDVIGGRFRLADPLLKSYVSLQDHIIFSADEKNLSTLDNEVFVAPEP
jgi:hypothetical protein